MLHIPLYKLIVRVSLQEYKLLVRVSVQMYMIRFFGVTLHMMRHSQHERIEVSFPEFVLFSANGLLNKSAI